MPTLIISDQAKNGAEGSSSVESQGNSTPEGPQHIQHEHDLRPSPPASARTVAVPARGRPRTVSESLTNATRPESRPEGVQETHELQLV